MGEWPLTQAPLVLTPPAKVGTPLAVRMGVVSNVQSFNTRMSIQEAQSRMNLMRQQLREIELQYGPNHPVVAMKLMELAALFGAISDRYWQHIGVVPVQSARELL